jgi:tRNA (mo5U34)-methyltransferase
MSGKKNSSFSTSLSPNEIRSRVRDLGEWFQNINLNGVYTAPDHYLGDYPMLKWICFADSIPSDLRQMSVLDIGCNAGFYSIEMKKRGAKRVLGIDHDEDYLAQARFAAGVCGADVEFKKMSVYDVAQLKERFDIVLFMGVLYHLRHPLLALDLLHEHVVKDLLVFQSMLRGPDEQAVLSSDYPFSEQGIFTRPGFPRLHFIEHSYSNDPTNWWIPNKSCVEAMLRSSGFKIISNPEKEVFICKRTDGVIHD